MGVRRQQQPAADVGQGINELVRSSARSAGGSWAVELVEVVGDNAVAVRLHLVVVPCIHLYWPGAS
jgi:hypothetical protein